MASGVRRASASELTRNAPKLNTPKAAIAPWAGPRRASRALAVVANTSAANPSTGMATT